MITLFHIFEHYGVKTDKVKLVRHGNKEISILDTFQSDRKKFEVYQSFQQPLKFSSSKHIAVFAPDKKTSALFLGLWDIIDYVENKDFTKDLHETIDEFRFPKGWHDDSAWYNLRYNPIMEELSERLLIEWGAGTIAWVQTINKEILEIKGKNSIGDFKSYDSINLTFLELKKLVGNPGSNITWVTALSNVNGIYLILEKSSGKLYVGSAYGGNGIYGRWQSYANCGDGGNQELSKLDPKNFVFSILEILPSTYSTEEVLERENRWKNKLGTRINGLNKN